ncbi:hypothetical protein [Ferrimicrobium sp.]|uniref:hypothetical protein n=1 Tax=Ferrimicrobium sp. TaxID=2926050 RepID=UPI00261E0FEA|nr:hypothetical protein [Ferrimicrobium sp.]
MRDDFEELLQRLDVASDLNKNAAPPQEVTEARGVRRERRSRSVRGGSAISDRLRHERVCGGGYFT